jgi:hypothetical protein
MNIYKKLQKCRVELQNKNLRKSGENKTEKFKYYELGDFLPTINVLFLENELSSNFSIVDNTAILEIVDCSENANNSIQFKSPIADADLKGCTPVQSLGAIHTYLKRYLYLNALELSEADILDPNAGNEKILKGKKETEKKSENIKNKPENIEYANKQQRDEFKTLVSSAIFANIMTNNNGKLLLSEYLQAKETQNKK